MNASLYTRPNVAKLKNIMLLSASLWKPCLYYLPHVLLKPQFSNVFNVFNFSPSHVCIRNVWVWGLVSVWLDFLIWQCETTELVCDYNFPQSDIYVRCLYCCGLVVVVSSCVHVQSCVGGRRLLTLLAKNVCICDCWALLTAWWDIALTSDHGAALRKGDGNKINGNQNEWKLSMESII